MCIFFGSEEILRSPRFFLGSKNTSILRQFFEPQQRACPPQGWGEEEEAAGDEDDQELG